MTIFKKVFECRYSGEVPDYFERVEAPEDVRQAAESAPSPADTPPAVDPFETVLSHMIPHPAPKAPQPGRVEQPTQYHPAPTPEPQVTSVPRMLGTAEGAPTVTSQPTTPQAASPQLDRSGGASAPRTRLLGFHRTGSAAADQRPTGAQHRRIVAWRHDPHRGNHLALRGFVRRGLHLEQAT